MSSGTHLAPPILTVYTNEDSPPTQGLIGPSSYPNMPPIYVHVNGVAKMLNGLNPNKATGPDQVPARILKETAYNVAPAMTGIPSITATRTNTIRLE